MVDRYDSSDWCHKKDDGAYVLYEDYEALEREVWELREKVEVLKQESKDNYEQGITRGRREAIELGTTPLNPKGKE